MTWFYAIADDGSEMRVYEADSVHTDHITTLQNDGSGFRLPADVEAVMRDVLDRESRYGMTARAEAIRTDLADGNIEDLDRSEKTESDLTWKPTVSEAQSHVIERIKTDAGLVLSETDWYITREQETGEAIPQDVLDHRAEVRSKSDTFEQEVNALETVDDVLAYEYTFPESPQ